MSKVELAATIHDPDARMLPLIEATGSRLLDLYNGNASVFATPATSEESLNRLADLGFFVSFQNNKDASIADNYRGSIKFAIRTSPTHIHYVDFDRALHWADRFPDELAGIIGKVPEYEGFVTFARTPRAFGTHPDIQKETESEVNSLASKIVGKTVDIMSGSFSFDVKVAQAILNESKRDDSGLYAEFFMIAVRNGFPITNIETEGLEWETPDRFKDEIEKKGFSSWLADFDNQTERRLEMVKSCREALDM